MTIACKHARWEQSDMVMVLLNISYIPDEVAHKMNFHAGWQIEFKKNMLEFKDKFYRSTGRVWEFQNKRLEDDYIDFINAQEHQDPDVIKEKTAEAFDTKFKDFFIKIKTQRASDIKSGNAIN